jgi:hypothetical protein
MQRKPPRINTPFISLNYMRRFLLTIGLLVLAQACSAPPSTPPTADSGTETSTAESGETEVATIPLGTPEAVRDDREITITKSEMLDSLQGNDFTQPIEAKGGKLVIVHMTVKNTGQESGNMIFSQFKLEDSQGRSYDEISDFNDLTTFGVWSQAQGLDDTNTDIFPGGAFNVAKIFRVAPDAESLLMVVNDKRFVLQ